MSQDIAGNNSAISHQLVKFNNCVWFGKRVNYWDHCHLRMTAGIPNLHFPEVQYQRFNTVGVERERKLDFIKIILAVIIQINKRITRRKGWGPGGGVGGSWSHTQICYSVSKISSFQQQNHESWKALHQKKSWQQKLPVRVSK